MVRVSKAEVERLSREVSVERLAEAKGVTLTREGKTLTGRCPFHEGDQPKLTIRRDTNKFHCEAGCEGGPIEWVSKAEAISQRHAAELLRSDFVPEADQVTQAKRSTKAKLGALVEPGEPDDLVLRRVVDYYATTLKESPEALGYLASHGLTHNELLDTFKIGFANRTLAYRLPAKNRKAGKELRSQLGRLGILRGSGHEHFNGSVVIPVFDGQGRVVQIYGRKIRGDLRKGTPLHLWLASGPRGVWNLAGIQHQKDLIVTGSVIDALTFWCAGFRNVTAGYGSEGIGQDHLAAFGEAGTRRVWIAYRRDKAGDNAADKIAADLTEAGIESYRVRYPRDKDANDIGREAASPEEALGRHLRDAEWAGKGKPRAGSIRSTKHSRSTQEGARIDTDAKEGEPETASKDTSDTIKTTAPAPFVAAPEPLEIDANTEEHQTTFKFGDRRWRVRGLDKNTSYAALRLNLLVRRETAFHVDTLELYSSRQRAVFLKQASEELQVEERTLKRDLGKILLKLEAIQEEHIRQALEPSKKAIEIEEADRQEALALLRDPDLLQRVLQDLDRLGLVGEETNKLVAYLAVTSRKLDRPLAVVVQSSSAAGKSSLMDAILALVPEEERASYSAMTGQSLYYLGQDDLAHKVLAIAEEEGASTASYALKLLVSEHQLTIASTGKDPHTGRLVTQSYKVEGPVMLFLTTTALDIDEELLGRSLVLTVDEGREQTRAIHQAQRHGQTLDGLLAGADRESILKLHKNAQRLLRPLAVINPFANELRFADHAPRTRRDHDKYLALIKSVTLLHQYQRPIQEVAHRGVRLRYIKVTRDDIETANCLAHEVLGRSLDELPPQTRRLLHQLHAVVADEAERHGIDPGDIRFTRKQVRHRLGIGDTQLRLHLGRLVEMEYVFVHRGSRGQRYAYELAYDGQGQDGQLFVPGIQPNKAITPTTETSRGEDTHLAGPTRPGSGQDAPTSRSPDSATTRGETKAEIKTATKKTPKRTSRDKKSAGSYPTDTAPST